MTADSAQTTGLHDTTQFDKGNIRKGRLLQLQSLHSFLPNAKKLEINYKFRQSINNDVH